MSVSRTDPKAYLEYMDKEMTIMGILSAVTVAAPAGVLSSVFGGKSDLGADLWKVSSACVALGSFYSILAALYFYRQRSTLAWLYGQICLEDVIGNQAADSTRINAWLREADSWETWWPYSWGFDALVACLAEYTLAVVSYLYPSLRAAWSMSPWLTAEGFINVLIVVALLISALLQRRVLVKFKFSDTPWNDFWKGAPKALPHDGVYTRLKPSPISGVGVFAIIDIPEGTWVFGPDDGPLIYIEKNTLTNLPAAIGELYKDFCVLQGSRYACPTNFNTLQPSWFLNRSDSPNVEADSDLKFRSIRAIRAGEEITVDYSTYSENESAD